MITPQTVLERTKIEELLDKLLQETFRGESVTLHTGFNYPVETESWVVKHYGDAWAVLPNRGHNKELSFEFSAKRS